MQALLTELVENIRPLAIQGKVASYIPALQSANLSALGACVVTTSGEVFESGDSRETFTMQSISKIPSFLCGLLDSPRAKIFEKISVEPTQDAFNSIVSLETKNLNRPLNPMINAGAIASLSFVAGHTAEEKFSRVLGFVRSLAGNPSIGYNEGAYESEMETGDRNRSLAYFMKSTGIIDGDVSVLLDAYFRICSIEVNCVDLAHMGATIGRDGVTALGYQLFPREDACLARTVMALCGMYNESGQYAVGVGIPSKSGVGGGIMGSVPGGMGIGVFGPSLNEFGSSLCGIRVMQELSQAFELSIF